jgi:hypothetical protein
MKPVFQTKFNSEGNCFAACVASLLACDINEVPFLGKEESWEDYELRLNDFLKQRYQLFVYVVSYDLEQYENFFKVDLKDTYYIVAGDAERGFFHSVVYKNGKLAHDPHPSGVGLLNVQTVYLFQKVFL